MKWRQWCCFQWFSFGRPDGFPLQCGSGSEGDDAQNLARTRCIGMSWINSWFCLISNAVVAVAGITVARVAVAMLLLPVWLFDGVTVSVSGVAV